MRLMCKSMPAIGDEFAMSIEDQKFVIRKYREHMSAPDLSFFQIRVEQTDLFIGVGGFKENKIIVNNTQIDSLVADAQNKMIECRSEIEKHIRIRPEFLSSLVPLQERMPCPEWIRQMYQATETADVGPMASIAGAIAQEVGLQLRKYCNEVIVENGGDIWLFSSKKRIVEVFAGESLLNGKVKLMIQPKMEPSGICTSSGKIGHSLSFGNADAVTVKAKTATLADAVATSLGNRIHRKDDIEAALKWACSIKGVDGALAIIDQCIGLLGDMELVK